MSGVQYAKFTGKRAPMFDAACAARVVEQVARFYAPGFDAAALVEAACGRYTRGKHKGALRGWATVTVCTEGGWRRHGPGERNGGVCYPGTVVGVSISDDYSGKVYLEVA
jgi:hypothetical protein